MDADEEIFDEILNHVNLEGDFTIMEHGIASGNTLCAILNRLIARNKLPKQVIGFDSFTGLCQEEEGVSRQNDWFPTAFNLLDENLGNKKLSKKASTWNEAYGMLLDRFAEYEKYNIWVKLVKGFYSDTLNRKAVEDYHIRPATFVNIDVDLYISAKQVLEFLFQNKLLANGAIIRYDDWTMRNVEEGVGGESKAHNEIVKKYHANFELIRKSATDAVFRFMGVE